MKRLFLNQIIKNPGEVISFDAEVLHHLKVLRVSTGDTFLFSTYPPLPTFGTIRIVEEDHQLKGKIETVESSQEISSAVHTMICALTKGDRNEVIIQKLSELGVERLILFTAERSIVKGKDLSSSKRDRFQKIALESAAQCGRVLPLDIKILENQLELKKEIDLLPKNCVRLIGALMPDTKPLRNLISPDAIHCMVIGPEGDFTENEYQFFCEVEKFLPASLGDLVLRSDTAAIAAAAAIQFLAR